MDRDDFRLCRNLRNRFKKMLFRDKKAKITDGFKRNKWMELREFEGKEPYFPSRLMINNKITASPKLIANEFSNFFLDKIKLIRDEVMNGHQRTCPMTILKNTLPHYQFNPDHHEVNSEGSRGFSFRKVTIQTVYDVILASKKSKSTGFDRLSMRSVDEMPQGMAAYTTHLFNSIIDTGKFPDVLKVTKILPLKKPGKDSLKTSSYRPIANHCTVEKIIEELLKRQLDEFMEENDIIPPEHHGGRRNHSTVTAKSRIDYNVGLVKETRKSAVLITCDLTAAYDTVDHGILIKKLKYHGITDEAANLLSSFLKDRQYFVEVQGFRSDLKTALNVSVIQGSKLASLLYTIYTSEIPAIHKIMNNPDLYKEVTGKKIPIFNDIVHLTTSYVDDSSSVVGANDSEEFEKYVQGYFHLLNAFYSVNILKLNGDKTKMMMVADVSNPISITTDKGEVISCDNQVVVQQQELNGHTPVKGKIDCESSSLPFKASLILPQPRTTGTSNKLEDHIQNTVWTGPLHRPDRGNKEQALHNNNVLLQNDLQPEYIQDEKQKNLQEHSDGRAGTNDEESSSHIHSEGH